MQPHVHVSAIHLLITVLSIIAVFGTLHLTAVTIGGRTGNALLALGL